MDGKIVRPKRHHRCAGERRRACRRRGDPRVRARHARRRSRLCAAACPLPRHAGLARHRPSPARSSTAAWCCGSRRRPASPARTWPSSSSMAAARWSRAVLDALSPLAGMRLAEPGEFTRRAFENGKLDLTAGRRPRRSDRCRDRGAAAAGAGAVGGRAGGSATKAGARHCSRRWRWSRPSSTSPTRATCRPTSAAPGLARIVAALARGDRARMLADAGRGERLRDGFRIVDRRTAQRRQVDRCSTRSPSATWRSSRPRPAPRAT